MKRFAVVFFYKIYILESTKATKLTTIWQKLLTCITQMEYTIVTSKNVSYKKRFIDRSADPVFYLV